jgi:two-component system CheB/CheR fusion protein
MADGQLILNDLPHEYGMRTAVDIFFRTLADTHGSRSTAIVLSGLDGDGSIGIKRIKENGGLTVAQGPNGANFPLGNTCYRFFSRKGWISRRTDMQERRW